MTERESPTVTVGAWRVYYEVRPAFETIVLIHADGPFTGGHLELAWEKATGEWTQCWSIGLDDVVPMTADRVVTEVFDHLGVTPPEAEVKRGLRA